MQDPQTPQNSKKRKSAGNDGNDSNSKSASKASATKKSKPLPDPIIPKDDHRLWGVNGLMYGLAIIPGTKRRTLRPDLPKKSSQQVGHNGLAPGKMFLSRHHALFHGCMGSTQSGVHSVDERVFSISISPTDDDLDVDSGGTILYVGTGAEDHEDTKEPPENSSVKALRATCIAQTPVRVLRGKHEGNEHAPVKGYRYDGLYRIVKRYDCEELDPKVNDGKTWRFIERSSEEDGLKLPGKGKKIEMFEFKRLKDEDLSPD